MNRTITSLVEYGIGISAFLIALILMLRLFKRFIRGSERRETIAMLAAWGLAIGFSLMAAFICDKLTSRFGSTVPGGLFEKREYEEWFYVNLFPESATSKNYRVPGLIVRRDGGGYVLHSVTFPNGGMVEFGWQGSEFETDRRSSQRDEQGREWKVEFTGQKVSRSDKTEFGIK